MSIHVGAVVALTVEKPVAGGRMLARHEGQIVLVAGAIPGERVMARVERTGRGVAHAQVIDVVEASPDRREGGDWRCGGNVLGFIAYARQLEIKRQIVEDAFARVGRIALAAATRTVPSPEGGYRLRTRLHVDGGRLGFYREGSRQLCDPVATGQLSPAACAWISEVAAALARSGSSDVVELEMAETLPGDARAVHAVLVPGSDVRRAAGLLCGAAGISAQCGEKGAVRVVAGDTVLTDRIPLRCGASTAVLELRRDVRAFFQGNRYLVEALVAEVVDRVPSGPVVDLYAGVGVFGLAVALLGGDDVTLVEGDEVSGANLAWNTTVVGGRTRSVQSSVEGFLDRTAVGALGTLGATVVIDPPRIGLSRDALRGLLRAAPERVVYVSCDPPTLARDARGLIDGGYALGEIALFDLFPNTAHVETVTTFARTGPLS